MPKVLLTGGSGFIASHILDVLLQRNYTVVTTVRSQAKADKIRANHPSAGDRLSFSIVEDIAQPDAFAKAVVSEPPFDFVLHTASPFHFKTTDSKKDLLDPAVNGTKGVLRAIKDSAPHVKRVVITSSFAAIADATRNAPNHTYSEKDWNGITEDEAVENANAGYRASKTFAEKAAWDFAATEKPSFDVVALNPPLVFGPIHANLQSLDSLNTSNERVRDMLLGKLKDGLQPSPIQLFVDVRDLAKAHVNSLEKQGAGGKRFFVVSGRFSNEMLALSIKQNLPQYADKLPADTSAGGLPPPEKRQGFDNSRSKEILGLDYIGIDQSIADTAKSLVPLLN